MKPITIFLTFALLSVVLLGNWNHIDTARAQSADTWTPPVNLSNSGSTTNPAVVTGVDGAIHAIWNDSFDGYKYSISLEGSTWTEPISVNFPFQDLLPRLISDSNRYIYAFWQDVSGSLLFSRVISSEFGNSAAWEGAQLLAQAALAFDVAVSENGALHLTYLRPLDTFDAPSGVYYRRLTPGSGSWSASEAVQTSLYLRGMAVTDAHVKIASGIVSGLNSVFITWDERPLRRIYFINSFNGGDSWGDPIEVDRPNVESGFSTPFDLDVEVLNDSILLLWKIGSSQSSCIHVYQVSGDGGSNWSDTGQVLEDAFSCSTQSDFLVKQSDMLVWQAIINGQVTLLAWNGDQWSDPRVQSGLTAIENPLTFESVNLGCQQLHNGPEPGRILAIACDQNQNGDIWFTSRNLGEVIDWFPSSSSWSKPQELFDVSNSLDSLELIADLSGNFHAFWTQPLDDSQPAAGSAIVYARWDGVDWSMPVPILASPDGKASNPSIALSSDGRIYVVWSAGEIGELFFSWAQAERAFSPSEWSQPISLPALSPAGSSPDLIVEPSGELIVAYAIPLNEARGVYVVRSADNGMTWTEPELIFDAAQAGWNMVKSPKISILGEGGLHLLWQQHPYPGDTDEQVLIYSNDLGAAANTKFSGLARGWSIPIQVDEGYFPWSQFFQSPSGSLYRLWFDASSQNNSLYQQFSSDEGASWSVANILGNFGEIIDAVDGREDLNGRLHLIQVVTSSNQQKLLRYWVGESERLTLESEFPLPMGDVNQKILDISIAVNPDGRLQLVYGVTETNRLNETRSFFAGIHQTIELDISGIPSIPASSSPTATPQSDAAIIITQEPTGEPTAEPTPTIALADLPIAESGPLPGSLSGIVILSGLVAGGLLIFILLLRANPLRSFLQQVQKDGKVKR